MPTAYIKKLADEGKGSVGSLEKKWERAKSLAKEAGHTEDFAYITGIFKKMVHESIDEAESHWLFGKAPRKGTVAYEIWKSKINNMNKSKLIEPEDNMSGIAKIKNRNESEINEAKKKIGEYAHGSNVTKVYKLTGEHDEGDPYVVQLHKNGKHYEPADYFTNDEDDAHGTAKHMVKESTDYEEIRIHSASLKSQNPKLMREKARAHVKGGHALDVAIKKARDEVGVKNESSTVKELLNILSEARNVNAEAIQASKRALELSDTAHSKEGTKQDHEAAGAAHDYAQELHKAAGNYSRAYSHEQMMNDHYDIAQGMRNR